MDLIRIYDDVLADPVAYRAAALARPFVSVPLGPITFHGIGLEPDATLPTLLTSLTGEDTTLTFFRQSPFQQPEPNFIHTDEDMGTRSAIFYLTPEPAPGDGTTFYRHAATGKIESPLGDDPIAEFAAWRDLAQWEPWTQVEAKFNRVVIFHAPLFHARSLFDNYGTAGVDARLIQMAFAGPPRIPLHSTQEALCAPRP